MSISITAKDEYSYAVSSILTPILAPAGGTASGLTYGVTLSMRLKRSLISMSTVF